MLYIDYLKQLVIAGVTAWDFMVKVEMDIIPFMLYTGGQEDPYEMRVFTNELAEFTKLSLMNLHQVFLMTRGGRNTLLWRIL
jgi:hypothetical protein